jgi:hypothetical protein
LEDRGAIVIHRLVESVLGASFQPPPSLVPLVPPGVRLRRGRLIPYLGGVMAGMKGSAAAVALRRTIILRPDVTLTRRLLLHELAHVRQWESDRLFAVRYSVETLRRGYLQNRYEREAREAEKNP